MHCWFSKPFKTPSLRDAFACPYGVFDIGHLHPGQIPREASDLEHRLDHLKPTEKMVYIWLIYHVFCGNKNRLTMKNGIFTNILATYRFYRCFLL